MIPVISLLLTIAVIVLDRLTKDWWIRHPQTTVPFSISGIFETTSHQNYGLIANIPIPHVIILGMTVVAIGFVLVALYQSFLDRERARMFSLSLILGGAVGNLWDRIAWGYVFDWILLFHRSAINVADISIALGILLYLLFGMKPAQRDASTIRAAEEKTTRS